MRLLIRAAIVGLARAQIAPVTCDHVALLYRESECCGNPYDSADCFVEATDLVARVATLDVWDNVYRTRQVAHWGYTCTYLVKVSGDTVLEVDEMLAANYEWMVRSHHVGNLSGAINGAPFFVLKRPYTSIDGVAGATFEWHFTFASMEDMTAHVDMWTQHGKLSRMANVFFTSIIHGANPQIQQQVVDATVSELSSYTDWSYFPAHPYWRTATADIDKYTNIMKLTLPHSNVTTLKGVATTLKRSFTTLPCMDSAETVACVHILDMWVHAFKDTISAEDYTSLYIMFSDVVSLTIGRQIVLEEMAASNMIPNILREMSFNVETLDTTVVHFFGRN